MLVRCDRGRRHPRSVLDGILSTVHFRGQGARQCSGPQNDGSTKPYFFAASGVSGGSVGLAHYAAHVASGDTDSDWPNTHAGDDEAAPMLAWFLFADIPSAFIGRKGGSDRAEMLERTWEARWKNGALSYRWTRPARSHRMGLPSRCCS